VIVFCFGVAVALVAFVGRSRQTRGLEPELAPAT
jgi:hypothetical protein